MKTEEPYSPLKLNPNPYLSLYSLLLQLSSILSTTDIFFF